MKKLLFILSIILLFSCENPVQEIPVIEEDIPEEIIYENVYKISGYMGGILKFDGTEYNIETMAPDVNGMPVITSYTETQRTISIQITIDSFSSFYFINNNMLNIKNIDPQNMNCEEFKEMLSFIYPPPEPEIPEYSGTRYGLSGYFGVVTDHLVVSEASIMIGGIVYFYDEMDNITYVDDTRKISINMTIDNKDSFLFINGNMLSFFNIDLADMSMDELLITADILNRYPAENVWVLKEEYNP